jgi:hypothetical protein
MTRVRPAVGFSVLLGCIVAAASAPVFCQVTNRMQDTREFVLRSYDGLAAADPGDRAEGWIARLESRQLTRSALLEELWNTPGLRDRAVTAVAAYQQVLRRDPTFAEFRAALKQLPAFAARSVWERPSNRAQATAAYLWLLSRPPTAGELEDIEAKGTAGFSMAAIGRELIGRADYADAFTSTVVRPAEYTGAFKNPLLGLRSDNYADQIARHPYTTLTKAMIPWNTLENNQSDGVDKIRQVTEQLFGGLPARNVKAIPRVYLHWPNVGKYWPADLTTDDFTSTVFRARMKRLIARLGQVWNNDPRIAFVDVGIIGQWGEEHHPSYASSGGTLPPEIEKELGDAYREAFPDKLIMNRYPENFVDYRFGIHWDVFGAPGNAGGDGTDLMTAALEQPLHIDRWQVAPRGGEMDPMYMGEPDWTLASMRNAVKKNATRLVEIIQRLHWNHVFMLTWLDKSDPDLWDKASQIQKALGYRLVIDEASFTAAAQPGGSLTVRLKVRNTGASAFYYPWPLEVSLLKPDTREVAWKAVWDGVDLRTWLPGRSIDILRAFALPASLNLGDYVVALAILDPGGMLPSARFAAVNYYNGGRTPLGPMSIGGSAPGYQLTQFDDIQSDQLLYYLPTLGPATGTQLLTNPPGLRLRADGNEFVAPQQFSWTAGSQHTVAAVTPQGTGTRFVFANWDDTSTQSSRTLTATGTPTLITANFTTQYLLTTAVSGSGSIEVVPASSDGYHRRGTEAQVTASPAAGCTFSGWSGDLTGNAAVITLMMSEPKNVTANFTCGGPAGYRFVPVTPCRVADTRNPAGPFGGPILWGGQTRSFTVPSSSCGIPASAGAYSLNVTVVPSGGLGYLSLWPAGQAQPVVSTLNSPDGRIKANAALVPAGTGGGVSLYATDATHVVLDISGYFIPASGLSDLSFFPLPPCRLADSRLGQPWPGPMKGGYSFGFNAPPNCGIPQAAKAYSLNFTVVPEGPLGYLTVWPSDRIMPVVSTLNAPKGGIAANAAIVPGSANGGIQAFVTDTTEIVIDANGYFAPPSGGGYSFYPLTPCRIADTRSATGTFGGPIMAAGTARSFPVPLSACNLPASAVAYSLNVTVVPTGGLGYLTLWPAGGSQPLVSTLNAPDGAITSNAAIVPAGASGGVSVFVLNTSHVILDINGYFAP